MKSKLMALVLVGSFFAAGVSHAVDHKSIVQVNGYPSPHYGLLQDMENPPVMDNKGRWG